MARSKSDQWRRFRVEQAERFARSGLPIAVCEDQWMFVHWMEHGYHPHDYTETSIDKLSKEQRAALVALYGAFREAGLGRLGIGDFTEEEWESIGGR